MGSVSPSPRIGGLSRFFSLRKPETLRFSEVLNAPTRAIPLTGGANREFWEVSTHARVECLRKLQEHSFSQVLFRGQIRVT
jgi:hypothetical protein